MLSFLITWLILLPICTLIGLWVLNVCNVEAFSCPGDRFIISVWLGIVVLCLSCITVALILPLSPPIGLLIGVIWIFLVYFSRNSRQDFYHLCQQVSLTTVIKGFLLTLGVAIFTTQQIIWFDTGLYHLGSIHWIAKFGAVPGVALIHSKFGFTSSWFAFSAPLIWDWSEGKIGAISNGFLMLISFLHLLLIFQKFQTKIANLSDKFIAIFLTLIMITYIADNVNGNSLISFSPDIPVALLVGIVSWVILIIDQEQSQSITNLKQSYFNSSFVALLLAIGAMSIKVTALPALGIVSLFYLCKQKLSFQRILITLSLIVILLLPNFAFSLTTSGCPLYPSTTMCMNLPWTVNQDIIDSEKDKIVGLKNFKINYNTIKKLTRNRWRWFQSSRKIQLTTGLYISSLLLIIIMIFRVKNKEKLSSTTQNWVFLLGFLGGSFIMISIPLIRFGIGYFLVSFSLFFANLLAYRYLDLLRKFFSYNGIILHKAFPILIIFLFLSIGQNNLGKRLFYPEKLPENRLIQARKNDINYTYPADFKVQCWGAKLPCAALKIKQDIQLYNQKKGIAAGFKW
ncbi:LIC_10190 family membrane protein [Crocosphaera sp.]|uniref:LIC_10190 family membrane protein n=1 Tax=Crocosphaera sp. TaxID=2729996 RepID=UPI003F2624B4|nr:hypothetical protein [Crocosphaera sp.]